MKSARRLWILVPVFLVTLSLGFYGPIFLENRRAELAVWDWVAQVTAAEPARDPTIEEETHLRLLREFRLELWSALEGADDLSFDGFPRSAVTAFLETGDLDGLVERDIRAHLTRLQAISVAKPERLQMLRSTASRVTDAFDYERYISSEKFAHTSDLVMWIDLLIYAAFDARADPGRSSASTRYLGQALDLARLAGDIMFVGSLVRGFAEDRVYEAVYRFLEKELGSPAMLRAEFEPRLLRNVSVEYVEACLLTESRLTARSLQALTRRETPCAGFSGDFVPLLATLEGLDRGVALAKVSPQRFIDQVHAARKQDLADDRFRELVTSMHIHIAAGEMLRVMLALCEYREQKASWPADLSALADSFPRGLPLDPHTGKPFPYTVNDGEITLGPPAIAVLDERSSILARSLH